MTLLERIVMAIYTLALVLLAAAVTAVMLGWQLPLFYWERLLLSSQQEHWIAAAAAGLVALVGLRVLVSLLSTKSPSQTLVKSTSTGEVHISLNAIEQIIERIARELEGIREVKPRIKTGANGVSILVEASVQPGVAIPQATEELQQKVFEGVQQTVGVQVKEVKVVVESIRKEKAAHVSRVR